MIRKALIVFFLIGLVVSAGLFAASARYSFSYIPESLRFRASLRSGLLWVTWPDRPYTRLTSEDLHLVLDMMTVPGPWGPEDTRRFLTARPMMVNNCARSGLGITRERPNFSALLYYSLRVERVGYQKEYHISVGLWVPALLCLAGGCVSFFHGRRRRNRKKLGLCLKCGYDLRASEERCPECGAGIADERP